MVLVPMVSGTFQHRVLEGERALGPQRPPGLTRSTSSPSAACRRKLGSCRHPRGDEFGRALPAPRKPPPLALVWHRAAEAVEASVGCRCRVPVRWRGGASAQVVQELSAPVMHTICRLLGSLL